MTEIVATTGLCKHFVCKEHCVNHVVYCVTCEDGNSQDTITSVLHILNVCRDIFNEVVIFFSAIFSIHSYVCNSKKYHLGLRHVYVCMWKKNEPEALGLCWSWSR